MPSMIPQDLNKEHKRKSMHYISKYSQLDNGMDRLYEGKTKVESTHHRQTSSGMTVGPIVLSINKVKRRNQCKKINP